MRVNHILERLLKLYSYCCTRHALFTIIHVNTRSIYSSPVDGTNFTLVCWSSLYLYTYVSAVSVDSKSSSSINSSSSIVVVTVVISSAPEMTKLYRISINTWNLELRSSLSQLRILHGCSFTRVPGARVYQVVDWYHAVRESDPRLYSHHISKGDVFSKHGGTQQYR